MINMTDKYVLSGTGQPARVLCVDAPGRWPVIAISGGTTYQFTADGRCDLYSDHPGLSLIPAPNPNLVVFHNVLLCGVSPRYCPSVPFDPTKLGTIRITRSPDRTKMISVEVV